MPADITTNRWDSSTICRETAHHDGEDVPVFTSHKVEAAVRVLVCLFLQQPAASNRLRR
jgi:hypothetical protein